MSFESSGRPFLNQPNVVHSTPVLNNPPKLFDRPYTSINNHNNRFNSNRPNGVVHDRLGSKPYHNNRNYNNNNRCDYKNDNFNRKRFSEPAFNNDATAPKRPWKGKWSQNNSNNRNCAQNRIERIRSSNLSLNSIPKEPAQNESPDLDATDITVQIVNQNAIAKEDESLCRFKMILDPKTQASIRTLQQKRKEKQVIFPIPVTPNVTQISLHERFSLL